MELSGDPGRDNTVVGLLMTGDCFALVRRFEIEKLGSFSRLPVRLDLVDIPMLLPTSPNEEFR